MARPTLRGVTEWRVGFVATAPFAVVCAALAVTTACAHGQASSAGGEVHGHDTGNNNCGAPALGLEANNRSYPLASCAGVVGGTQAPLIHLRLGARVILRGLGNGYSNPESSDPLVLSEISSSSETAQYRAARPGVTNIALVTRFCAVPSTAPSGCIVARFVVNNT